MSTDDKPKSAVELAMERLRRKDADSGVTERPTTDEQKAAIAEARNLHASKVAELEILHRSKVAGLFDPAERAQADEAYRRDLARSARRSRTKDCERCALRGIDFFVYISDNVLSHICLPRPCPLRPLEQ